MTDQASLFDGGPDAELDEQPKPRPVAGDDDLGFDYWRILWAAARKGNKP